MYLPVDLSGYGPRKDDDSVDPVIYVRRDIPGDHVGGPGCFCVPFVLRPEDSDPWWMKSPGKQAN